MLRVIVQVFRFPPHAIEKIGEQTHGNDGVKTEGSRLGWSGLGLTQALNALHGESGKQFNAKMPKFCLNV